MSGKPMELIDYYNSKNRNLKAIKYCLAIFYSLFSFLSFVILSINEQFSISE